MIKSIFLLVFIIACSNVFAQNEDCRVNRPEISGSYHGGCKNGLASGKGVAQGVDRYEGQFSKGMPNGRGTYKWANGVYYEGEWENGLRNGSGKMVYPDSVVTGFWKEDKFVGKKLIPPYKILTSLSVARSSISKSADKNVGVKVRIMQGGLDNISIEDFSMAYDSGTEYKVGNYYGLENVNFPLTVKVKYRSWNQLMTSQTNVVFEFIITDPGNWNVIINN